MSGISRKVSRLQKRDKRGFKSFREAALYATACVEFKEHVPAIARTMLPVAFVDSAVSQEASDALEVIRQTVMREGYFSQGRKAGLSANTAAMFAAFAEAEIAEELKRLTANLHAEGGRV
ncbi:hypothetical protein [Jiella sp. M17.18]|uniref:hypothetical protein n=1 Tax=Jiella sp. M17.18 TaxID=3234247 RepID=UPI0034DEDF3D